MKTIERQESIRGVDELVVAAPVEGCRHGRRYASWKVLSATVGGFPAFLWQLTKRN